MDRTILLASFLFPERLDWFLQYLENKFKIKKDNVFCYKNIDDESKLIVTFKIKLKEGKKIDIKELFPGAILIHKKGDALYTINAMNKLIESTIGDSIGNIDHKNVIINWSDYQNKLLLTKNNNIIILNIKRIF